ncbi:MAG TPA: hypothetical protein VFS17_07160, partial [Methylophilaceae bacterium]|nr:hypothetical protein [Methylophilaceae bacterium]
MITRKLMACLALAATALPTLAFAADDAELESIRSEIREMKQNYEARIHKLEAELQAAQNKAPVQQQVAAPAETATPAPAPAATPTAANAFNPGISLILSGIYANRSQDSDYHITGFQSGGEIGPGLRGLSLAESELGLYANVDHYFYGGINLAVSADDEISVEEGFVQTTALPYGLTIKGGRFFSGVGYLNEQHAHTWDFVDTPLAYQAFLGGQYGDDGVQVRWVAPTDTLVELGAEVGRGRIAGTKGKDRNGAGMGSVFAHVGGDIGISSSWRAGLSYLHVSTDDRESPDLDVADRFITNRFDGDSNIWIADFTWKWAPNGNPDRTNFKLQGEYLNRQESGNLAYDIDSTNSTSGYHANQSGWYVQGIYQFRPYWRTGVRYDQLNAGNVDYGSNSGSL